MKIAFISCWCHLRIYAIQASHLREHIEKHLTAQIKVITSNCGCFHPSLSKIFTSLYTYKTLLTDRKNISFIKLPHLRSKNGLSPGNCIRNSYRSFAEPLRGFLYHKYTSDFDIVHFHQSNDSFGYDSLRWFLRLNRTAKIVVQIYGLSSQQKEDPSLNEIYNLADAVIVSTDFLKNILIQSRVEPTKIHVIPYGVILKPLNNKKREGFIMFAGSPLIDVKGFQYLAPALRILKEKGKHLNLKLHGFYMAGHKEWATSIAKDEGVDDMLTWLSIGSEDELHEHYQKSIGCIIPYINYPGCFPAAVAMANKTPLISSDAMGLPEQVNGSGIVTTSKSIESLVDALSELIDNEHLRTMMGAKGRKTAEEKNNWDVVSKQTVEVYKKLIKT